MTDQELLTSSSRRDFLKVGLWTVLGRIFRFRGNNGVGHFDLPSEIEIAEVFAQLPPKLKEYLGSLVVAAGDTQKVDGSIYNPNANDANPKSTFCMPAAVASYLASVGSEPQVSSDFIKKVRLNSSWLVHTSGNSVEIDGNGFSRTEYSRRQIEAELEQGNSVMVVFRPHSENYIGHWVTVVKVGDGYQVVQSAPLALIALKTIDGGGTYVTTFSNIESLDSYLGRQLPSFITYGNPQACWVYLLQ